MPLSWNEIKSRALAFSKEWENDISEDAEAKSFWDDFFNVFGISRRRVATFEQQIKKLTTKQDSLACSGKVPSFLNINQEAKTWIKHTGRPKIIFQV